jgi:hypothetical protein
MSRALRITIKYFQPILEEWKNKFVLLLLSHVFVILFSGKDGSH